ncbi:hypothetical protein ACHAW5_008944 [Stephanodiscus triporus]|uniref:Uncharacterized protein n=1 Tax=Stephanodiscus triporus TaxID=2934178 RepID=A0ABD3NPR5_9STRA
MNELLSIDIDANSSHEKKKNEGDRRLLPSACPPKIQRRTLRGHRGPVLCLAHSSERPPPPSRGSLLPRDDDDDAHHHHHHHQGHHPSLLLSGSEDGTARLWDLRTRRTSGSAGIANGTTVPRRLHADPGTSAIGVTCATFWPKSHDGGGGGRGNGAHSYLVTAGTDCAVKLWDAGDGRPSRLPTSIATIGPRHVDDPSSSSSIRLCNPPYVPPSPRVRPDVLLAVGSGTGPDCVSRGGTSSRRGRMFQRRGRDTPPRSRRCASRTLFFRRDRARTEMDRLLISPGTRNDSGDLARGGGGDRRIQGRTSDVPHRPRPKRASKGTGGMEGTRAPRRFAGRAETGALTSSSPSVLFKIEHRHKQN